MKLGLFDKWDEQNYRIMQAGKYVIYDHFFKIVVKTTNGHPRRGNKRKYFVKRIVRQFDKYTGRLTTLTVLQFGFKAHPHEVYEKFRSDKRVEKLYKEIWQSEFNQFMANG